MYKYLVTLNEWIEGQGYRCSSSIDTGVTERIFPASDWNFQDNPIIAHGDVCYEVIVEFYAIDADPMFDDPISTDSCWIDC